MTTCPDCGFTTDDPAAYCYHGCPIGACLHSWPANDSPPAGITYVHPAGAYGDVRRRFGHHVQDRREPCPIEDPNEARPRRRQRGK